MSEYKIRIPNAETRKATVNTFKHDEDFSFNKGKLLNDASCKFTFDTPTEDDPDETFVTKRFAAVVLFAKPAQFKDKETGIPGKEMRALHILRAKEVKDDGTSVGGSIVPEFIYMNNSSMMQAWKPFCLALKKGIPARDIPAMTPYYNVLIECSATRIDGKKFKWTQWVMKPVRVLTPKEQEWVSEIMPLVEGRIRVYASHDELDAAENEILYGKPVQEDEVPVKRVAIISGSDEEDEAPVKAASTKKAPPVADEDDEDAPPVKAAPAKKATAPSVEMDDEDAPPPPPARRRARVNIDDED